MTASDSPISEFVRPSSFWDPIRLVLSAWTGHIPFTFWLVDALRPSAIVELGTHTGNSFAAMCQATSQLGLTTTCTAVDTWKGDEHAGFYDDDVYEEFAGFVRAHFSDRVCLVRSTFDEAVGSVADGSIDLLHIDGMHTYEAVRHDFETWLPKVSDRGVVLFHDTNVYDATFGVHKFWHEVVGRYPSFEFNHSHGLGVLLVGRDVPPAVRRLAEIRGEPETLGAVRNAYARLGQAVLDRYAIEAENHALGEIAQHLQGSQNALRQSVSDVGLQGERIDGLIVELEEARRELATAVEREAAASLRLAGALTELDRLRAVIGPSEESYVDLKLRVWSVRDFAIGAEATTGHVKAQLRAAEAETGLARATAESARETVAAVHRHLFELERVREQRDAMLRSPTWRVGALLLWPLRRLRRLVRRSK